MLPTISIIVPVYNTQKYLSRCIKSILGQTFGDFELILINDGSTDESGKICDEFASQDKRIKVFHQENRGVSSARNVGLKEAKGEWIGFVDSDDWIVEDMFEKMYKKTKLFDTKVVVCSFKEVMSGSAKAKKIYTKDGVLNQKDAILSMLDMHGFGGYICNKLVKSSLIKEQGITFDTNIRHKEDLYFFYRVFLHTQNIYFFSNALYNYNVMQPKKSIKKRELTFFYTTQRIIKEDKRESIIQKAKISEVYSAIGYYVVCLENGYEKRVREYFKKRVDMHKTVFYRDLSTPFRYKIYAFLTPFPKLFSLIFKIKTKIRFFVSNLE